MCFDSLRKLILLIWDILILLWKVISLILEVGSFLFDVEVVYLRECGKKIVGIGWNRSFIPFISTSSTLLKAS